MRKLGCQTLHEMIGKLVTITTEPDKKDSEKRWLRIAK